MHIIEKAVSSLEERMEGSGCEDTPVTLMTPSCRDRCQFESGACMTASFGGVTGEFSTFSPIRATTQISFMFGGVPLDTPTKRIAAAAILNAAAGFFCIARKTRSCPQSSHKPCLSSLREEIRGSRVFSVGEIAVRDQGIIQTFITSPDDADILLVTGEGMAGEEGKCLVPPLLDEKRILFLGPSTAGVASLLALPHWCPYGERQ